MHVAVGDAVRGAPSPYDELLEAFERRLAAGAALPPAARLRAARPGPPEVGGRPAPQPALPRARDGSALPRLRGAAEGPRRPRLLPAARPRQAALGGVAGRGARGRPLRDALEDPPRARGRHLGRGHHVGAVRHVARADRAARPGRALAAAPAPELARSCSARRCSSAPRCPPRSSARCARCSAAHAASSARRARRRGRRRRDGLGRAQPRAAQPLQPADRAAPALHLGARRACATSRRSRTSSAAPSTTSCWRPWRARWDATCAAAARAPTGSS